jgi:hypothetical protein
MHSRLRGCGSLVECCIGTADPWGGTFRKKKDKAPPIREWPQFIPTLQGCSGFFVYVRSVENRITTDRFLAQHDFSQDPIFMKSKDGHLVRRARTSFLLSVKGFGFFSSLPKNILGNMKLSWLTHLVSTSSRVYLSHPLRWQVSTSVDFESLICDKAQTRRARHP